MTSNSVFSVKNLKAVIIIALATVIVVLAASLLQTPKYQSSAKLLIVFSQEDMDVFTASQNANYIAGILSEVIYSNSFIDQVYRSNFDLRPLAGNTAEKKARNWKNMVKVKVRENKGILQIDVLSSDRNQANQLAQAVAFTIINKHASYHGSGDKVSIRLIEEPMAADRISQPKIWLNLLIGLIAGLIIGLTLVIIFPQQRLFESSLWKRKHSRRDKTIDLIK